MSLGPFRLAWIDMADIVTVGHRRIVDRHIGNGRIGDRRRWRRRDVDRRSRNRVDDELIGYARDGDLVVNSKPRRRVHGDGVASARRGRGDAR